MKSKLPFTSPLEERCDLVTWKLDLYEIPEEMIF